MEHLKAKISKLKDMDAPAEVIEKYENVLKDKVKKAMSGKKMSWDPLNNCWVEDDQEGIPVEGESEKGPSAPKISIILKIGE